MSYLSFQSAVIVGSTGGLGAAISRQLLTLFPNIQLAALSRDGSGVPDLSQQYTENVLPIKWDITNENSVHQASEIVKEKFAGQVDLVWNCAGTLSLKNGEHLIKPEKSITWINQQNLEFMFAVNTFGVAYLGKYFLPVMKTTKTRKPKVFASISARVGSIEDNKAGGWVTYRASKAASNQMLQVMAIEHAANDIAWVSLQPGTVATALSAPFRAATAPGVLQADDAAAKLVDVVSTLELSKRAQYLDYAGKIIPW